VGQSGFKCSLAVKRRPDDGHYSLAILVDDEQHYRNGNLIEQYYQRPAILRSFGWMVLPVYAKDWLHQPQKVMEQVWRALGVEGGNRETAPMSANGPYDHLEFRRLELGERFWEAAADSKQLIIRRGRPGSKGQITLRTFPDEGSARDELDRQWEEQRQKGNLPVA